MEEIPVFYENNEDLKRKLSNNSILTKHVDTLSISSSSRGATRMRINITDKLLGKGSFGKVYLAKDQDQKEYAVKCSKRDTKGLPNLFEASIMCSYNSDVINQAERVHANNSTLFIVQKRAIGDLRKIRKKEKYSPSPEYLHTIKRRCYKIAQAVSILHNEKIIHADIKPSNVLVFSDSIKLCDFTVSVKRWNGEKFSHEVGTSVYRPPENLLKKEWDESLDIWSLACTFYEIAYGKSLFEYQGSREYDDDRKTLRKKAFNTIIDWAKDNDKECKYKLIPSIEFTKSRYCSDYEQPIMKSFNSLLDDMLKIDPSHRPSIIKVLKHPFFNGMRRAEYQVIVNSVSLQDKYEAETRFNDYNLPETTKQLAIDLFLKSSGINISEKNKVKGCIFIACKLTYYTRNEYFDEMKNDKNVLEAEVEVCHSLRFRLHNPV